MYNQSVASYYKCKPKIPNQEEMSFYGQMAFGKRIYNSPTEIGIEIEIEKLKEVLMSKYWKVEKDGSLRDNGYELISCPLKDENILYFLESYKNFLDLNPKSTFSHRCSIHVHLNMSNATVGQLHSLVATYLAVENLFFTLVDLDRKGNSYCYPLADALLSKEDLKYENLNEDYKYSALNPHHLLDYGTIEFRHHQGTKDIKDLLNWIEMCFKLYTHATTESYDDIKERIQKLNTISNYDGFLYKVFGEKSLQFVGMDLHKALRENVTAAKYFLE